MQAGKFKAFAMMRIQSPVNFLNPQSHAPAIMVGVRKTLRLIANLNLPVFNRRNAPGKPLELYDLPSDPSEAKDIAADQPDVVAKIEAYLKTARTASKHWPGRAAKPKKKR